MTVDLRMLFGALQAQLDAALHTNSVTLDHPTSKGDATEGDWASLFATYLPTRYEVTRAKVIDSRGDSSDLIDLVVHDRQYSPLLFKRQNECYIPAESVYAVFEVKQDLDKVNMEYAAEKVASVRKLYRTSIPIAWMGKTQKPREPIPILGGILTSHSAWTPPFGKPFDKMLRHLTGTRRLDVGCALKHGAFEVSDDGSPRIVGADNALIDTFMTILRRLQAVGTVPAMDLNAYAQAYRAQATRGVKR